MSTEDRISVTIEGGVADVRLVRTDKMNALDNAMFEALIQTGERLKAEVDPENLFRLNHNIIPTVSSPAPTGRVLGG